MTVKLRYSDFETHTSTRALLAATERKEDIRRVAFECFRRLEMRKKVRLVGVRVSGLIKI